tara:strand:+ start:325 stop:438 length:114 start_codon:yes stop_codon:yes gene_type:complete
MIEFGVIYGFAIGITCEQDLEFDLRIFLGVIYLQIIL